MPTGVLRDVWIALASLADRPGHRCRLERVWVRWHDNSESPVRAASAASSLTLPQTQAGAASPATISPLLHRYGHVEYPSLSIVPPLKSLSVLDIDEPSYIEEAAVLIHRSWDRMKELRIGISSRVYQADWLKPLGGSSREPASTVRTGWPKIGGVLGALLGKSDDQPCPDRVTDEASSKKVPESGSIGDASSSPTPQPTASSEQSLNAEADSATPSTPAQPSPAQSSVIKDQTESSSSVSKPAPSFTLTSDAGSKDHLLQLETLALERVPLSIPVMLNSLDWTQLTSLTILRCEGHEKLWRSLRRQFSPSSAPPSSPRTGRKGGNGQEGLSSEHFLRLKHIHTDAVSPYLLLFIKDTLAPNTLETLFLHEAPITERSVGGVEIATSRWRKWMFTRDMVSFVTSGRMPRLRELSMTIHSKDWHYFLQRLPNVPQLRAIHIPHIAHPVHRDPKELALQILDIIIIRPEVGLSYVGMQNKCYEILEGKRGDKVEFDDADDSHSEGLGPGIDWSASESEEDGSDGTGAASAMDSNSELSSDRALSDIDDSDLENHRSRVTFRLREILFYDDKIAIFKARHGVL
ncbi:hypothetical protein EYZ11_004534 [Aspergillus tanneri]|uniref:F-box domain-containing protein n=1 Tax=Aspergillus tanneri TaxID=1220188 RepID=A0A4S3JMM9_9EURO|nr:hypothetical protein EYZ11_004534 [Aspergillus tanneri]